MSFKVHLLIICVIIIVTYFAVQLVSTTAPTQSVVTQPKKDPYSISIIHASWGLNCRYGYIQPGTQKPDSFANSSSDTGPKEDNVYSEVYELCNGKKTCLIKINGETLGKHPAKGCGNKELKVEYRCFSFDHPWIAQAKKGQLFIDCDKESDKDK